MHHNKSFKTLATCAQKHTCTLSKNTLKKNQDIKKKYETSSFNKRHNCLYPFLAKIPRQNTPTPRTNNKKSVPGHSCNTAQTFCSANKFFCENRFFLKPIKIEWVFCLKNWCNFIGFANPCPGRDALFIGCDTITAISNLLWSCLMANMTSSSWSM